MKASAARVVWIVLLAAVLYLLLAAPFAATGLAQQGSFAGEITVGRVLTEVRVLDTASHPVLGLQPEDFEVTIGGIRAEVESAEWIESPPIALAAEAGAMPDRRPRTPGETEDPRAARQIVLLVQVGFENVRLTGLYRMSFYAMQLVRGLSPTDRVALVVYDRHLQLHSDFTNDFEHVAGLLEVPRLVEWFHSRERRSEPSLVDSFDFEAAKDAATMQQGLRVLAQALEPIPGPKSIVFLGWGMGRFGSSGVVLSRAYTEARMSLARSHTNVFSLDITNADYHTLEVGLQAVAEDTGGFYAKTHLFPQSAVGKLTRVISGYYELSLVQPPELQGFTSIEVEVPGRKATVLVRPVVLLSDSDSEQKEQEE